jgi:hypothetical protein
VSDDSLVLRLITLIKQHRKPSSAKSIKVIKKVMEDKLLQPNHTEEEFKAELNKALESTIVLSELIRQQHSEEEIRNCFSQLLIALDAPDEEEVAEGIQDSEEESAE